MNAMDPAAGAASAVGAEHLGDAYREQPWWWSAAAPQSLGPAVEDPVPRSAEVVIVGAGITGVVAAMLLARAGMQVLLVDALQCGEGAARRNAGYLGRTLKRSAGWMEQRFGADHARRVYGELDRALQCVAHTVATEGIECHHVRCGRFVGANSPAHFRVLAGELEDMRRLLGFEYELLQRHDQHREIATDVYHGGAVIPDLGALHPGLYHEGLLRRALEAGARVVDRTPVTGVGGASGSFRVQTARGTIEARHVVVTTNGYTDEGFGWLARRVIPFTGYAMATEVLPRETIERILPGGRTYIDTKMNVDFVRKAPDADRIVFGGMTGTRAASATALVPRLRERMVRLLPDLEGVRIDRAWSGNCAGTFDFLPHIGQRDGVHFALGYNFAGVPVGTLFGYKLAARVLGQGEAGSVFDTARFPTLPLYNGRPWFVPLAMRWFDWKDARLARSG